MDRKSDTHFDIIGPSAASLRLAVLFAAFASVAAQSKGMLLLTYTYGAHPKYPFMADEQ
jgi:hypothetical protein